MARPTITSAELIDGLSEDVLWLLILIYAFVIRSRFEGLANMSRDHFALEAILLESASRDIIARLTALDDDTRNNRSFQTLLLVMKKENIDPGRIQALDKKVKAYRRSLTALKVDHRNRYIAHVGNTAEVRPRVLDAPVEFSVAASMAVNLLDDFAENQISYTFRAGSRELPIDLRQALS